MNWNVTQPPVTQSEIDSLPTVQTPEKLVLPDEWPDFTNTPPDSIKLVVSLAGGPEPTSANAIPGAITTAMPRELATYLAVELNRETLHDDKCDIWHLVAVGRGLTGKGYCVVRVRMPSGWRPEHEYSTPPSEETGLMNTEVRMSVKRFNQVQLNSGGQVRFWQLFIKPLEYPKLANHQDLNVMEARAVEHFQQALACAVAVEKTRSGALNLKIDPGVTDVIWSHEREGYAGLAKRLRLIASKFLNAAEKILPARVTAPSLSAVEPNSRLIRVGDRQDVHLLVDGVRSDEEAFQRARETLSISGV
ncbi:hypothetical protein SH661x_003729 [Planctomicrobium sp. SH661]|uniref:hypothetical protein n=1 Tax=Planctomicrobium sp. SH661 TaxID=3448124 RepID=UPI003F5C1400